MKDQNGIEDGESKQDKWNRGLDIFIESVIKPDSSLRQCAHNQRCCLLYTSPSPRDLSTSRMPSSA